MNIEYIETGLLRPYEKNAKKHPEKQVDEIANSIREFGFRQPLVVDRDGVIVIGHGRFMAAKKIGLDSVPCIRADDLTPQQIKALRLADNKTNESDWDADLLNIELGDIFDLDMSRFGFDMIAGNDEPVDVVDDEVPEEAPIRAKLGDIYQLGEHRLMCGDSTNADDVQKLMGESKADISLTSPPYGAANSAKIRDHYVKGASRAKSFYNQHDDDICEWRRLIEKAFANMQAHSQSQFVNIQMLADNKRDLVGWVCDHVDTLNDIIVWDKKASPPQMQKNILNNRFEFVFVFSNDNGSRTIPFADFHGSLSNIIELTTGVNEYSDIHRAVFPVAFPVKILEYASLAESVLDLFGGTGTTLIACEQLNRKCYMMELDPHYCDVIIARWEQFTGETAILIN